MTHNKKINDVLEKKLKDVERYKCSVCGQVHEEWPALAFEYPDAYATLSEEEKKTIAKKDSDVCIIEHDDQTDRLIRVVLEQKVNDTSSKLHYGLWVSLSEQSLLDYLENSDNDFHDEENFGWLNNSIGGYDDTTVIPMTVVTRRGVNRPEIIPHEDFDCAFVKDYYSGISKEEAERRIHNMMKRWS